MTASRRQILKMISATGLAAVGPYGRQTTRREQALAELLPHYAESARRNIVTMRGEQGRLAGRNIVAGRGERAILSSRAYPKGTFVRDAFYGPMALNDAALSRDCYRWFERTQLPNGQIMTAVGFTPEDQANLSPMDDDSSMLFVIWSAWLKSTGVKTRREVVERAFAHVQSHVNRSGEYVSPAGPFRYWADTVSPEKPERITHNQGLYTLVLQSMRSLGWGGVNDRQVADAKKRYAACYNTPLDSLTLGRDSWWARKLDISTVFPEFLFRWAFGETALPDAMVTASVARMVRNAAVYNGGKIVGIKVICDTDGAFLPSSRFHVPALNGPGDYQNGGYWPMYTLTALALAHKIAPSKMYRSIMETLVIAELASDHVSKEIIMLRPGDVGSWDPKRNGYTWNALIAPALEWAGVV